MYEKRVKQNRVCGGARGKLINSFARRDCFIRNTLKEQNLIHISVGPRRYIIVGYTVVGERGGGSPSQDASEKQYNSRPENTSQAL